MRRMRTGSIFWGMEIAMVRLALLLVLGAAAAGAQAHASEVSSPAEVREIAFEVLGFEAVVLRAESNCRWIRGHGDGDAVRIWEEANFDFTDAAGRIVRSQGGLTPERAAVVEGLAGLSAGSWSESREACGRFFGELRGGSLDVHARVPVARLQALLGARDEAGGRLWVLEERRGADGTLGKSARPYLGGGDIEVCEKEAAALGHVHLRGRFGTDMMPVPDVDPELWLAECMRSVRHPVDGGPSAGG